MRVHSSACGAGRARGAPRCASKLIDKHVREQSPRTGHASTRRCKQLVARASGTSSLTDERPAQWSNVSEGFWEWRGYRIRYQRSGDSGPAVLMVHGFGGNCDHWRKNTPEIGKWGRAYAIDLLGYGYSDKPDPRGQPTNSIYNFDNWADQLEDFIDEVIGEPAFIVCNSVGGLAGLQASIQAPEKVKGVQILNISLRMLHVKNQNPLVRPLISSFQRFLRETTVGEAFFKSIATPKSVKTVLQEAYHDPATVTDELVDCILKPGLEPGAVSVFLDFISYSSGPLPGDLIEACPVPLSMLWGDKDPWEKVEWGRKLGTAPTVSEFIELPNVGHCPQDEAPQVVNPLVHKFVARHI